MSTEGYTPPTSNTPNQGWQGSPNTNQGWQGAPAPAPAPATAGYSYPYVNPRTEKNSTGTWSMALGILGLLLIGLFGSIPAWIMGNKALRYCQEGRADNEGVARAGQIMGIVGTVLGIIAVVSIIFLIVSGTFLAFLGAAADSSTY